MKAKTLVFEGPADSGKTRKAREIFNTLNKSTPNRCVLIDGRQKKLFESRFAFSCCESHTEVVIIDDVAPDFNWETLFYHTSCGIMVEQWGKVPFIIEPMFIVATTQAPDFKNMGASWSHRFLKLQFPLSEEEALPINHCLKSKN